MKNDEMTSRERVMRCINNEATDRIPLINPTSVATLDSCRKLGITFNEVHLNAEKMAALAGFSYESLGFDSVTPYFSVIQEAAALGCEIDWGTGDAMPYQKIAVFTDPDQFKFPLDFFDRLPIKTVIEAIKLLRKKFGNDVAIIGKVMGPWTLAYHLYGVENLLVDTLLEPEKVRAFLDKFMEVSLKFAEAQFDAGADIVTLADHATADLVSPKAYKEFLLPIHKIINKKLKEKTVILHCCGNTYDRIPYFAEAGFPIFHFDSKNDIQKSIIAAGNMKLTGCINNPETLLKGSTIDVEEQVTKIIEAGIKLISPECAIPLMVKNENLAVIKNTILKYSKKI